MKLLLAEDDPLLGEAIQDGLTFMGHQVEWFQDGQTADLALRSTKYDSIILDLGLPRKNGMTLLSECRKSGIDTPILILTAMDGISDRVAGLDNGADDYLVKPFDMNELAARLRALDRRRSGRARPYIEHGELTIYPDSNRVEYRGKNINLTRHEFILLTCLIDRPGQIYSNQTLEEHLYPWDQGIESNTIQVHVHHLRKKLYKTLIRNVHGIGYVIDKFE